jgi:hypothetical protein
MNGQAKMPQTVAASSFPMTSTRKPVSRVTVLPTYPAMRYSSLSLYFHLPELCNKT